MNNPITCNLSLKAAPWHHGKKWIIIHPWNLSWFWDNLVKINYLTPFPSFCFSFWFSAPGQQNMNTTFSPSESHETRECLYTHMPLIKILHWFKMHESFYSYLGFHLGECWS
jgi:hypothetical protein